MTLQGILIQLRAQSEADAADVIALRNNPEYNQFLSNSGQKATIEDQIAWLRREKDTGQNHNFSIFLGDKFCGACSLYNIHDGEAEFGRYIVTNPIAAIESEYLCLQFALEQLGLKQVVCKTLAANEKVCKQHLRLGFTTVGEGFEERVQQPFLLQVLTAEAFRQFDYAPVLSMIQKLKR